MLAYCIVVVAAVKDMDAYVGATSSAIVAHVTDAAAQSVAQIGALAAHTAETAKDIKVTTRRKPCLQGVLALPRVRACERASGPAGVSANGGAHA